MIVPLTLLLTIGACALKECKCGGTFDSPIPDVALCKYMTPPGMEGKETKSRTTISSQMFWSGANYLFILVSRSVPISIASAKFYGYMLQARVNNKPCGTFVDIYNNTNNLINCAPYFKVRYSFPQICLCL